MGRLFSHVSMVSISPSVMDRSWTDETRQTESHRQTADGKAMSSPLLNIPAQPDIDSNNYWHRLVITTSAQRCHVKSASGSRVV
jgi:hypothetical protein